MRVGLGLFLHSSSAPPSGGAYTPNLIEFDGSAYLQRNETEGGLQDALTGVSDSPQGYVTAIVKPKTSELKAIILATPGFQTIGLNVDSNGAITFEVYDEEANSGFSVRTDNAAVPFDVTSQIIVAWDMNFAEENRRIAAYVDDVLAPFTFTSDDYGDPFDIDLTVASWELLSPQSSPNQNTWGDVGLWLGSTIVEADSTISEANRRKFVDANGDPVNPTNWPANPVVKFSGPAASFLTNQGSGGAFTLAGGNISDV